MARLMFLLAPAFLVGCFEELACDTSLASSVTVSVLHADQSLATSEGATYSVDGSPEAPCDSLDAFGGEYVCGYEETGRFDIWVDLGGGEVVHESLEVFLRPDGCHVDSQFIEIYVD